MPSVRTSQGTPARSARPAASTQVVAPLLICGAGLPIVRRTLRGTRHLSPSHPRPKARPRSAPICWCSAVSSIWTLPVVKYWPEFGAAGKENIPVRWLLSHQAGLPIVNGPLTFEEACAWHPVIRALEAQKPEWEPGTEHVYRSVMHLIARPSPESARGARAEDYAAPPTLEEMTAGMIETTGLDQATVVAWMNAVWGPDSVQARAAVLGGALDPTSAYMNTRAWRAAEFPCCNMFADARWLGCMRRR